MTTTKDMALADEVAKDLETLDEHWPQAVARLRKYIAALRRASSPAAIRWPEPKITNPDIANPTGVPYLDCLIHRVLDAQQDINVNANETMSQSVANAASLMDEVEAALRLAAILALSRPAATSENE